MENTIENKSKFFALYWGQNILLYNNAERKTQFLSFGIFKEQKHIERSRLLLKPLSSISDEDAIEVANLLSAWYSDTDENAYYDLASFSDYLQEVLLEGIGGLAINNTQAYGSVIDFLRSRGYALPWRGLSVEELVIRGWVKLKGETK